MELNLVVDQKNVQYVIGENKGEGLRELTEAISGYDVNKITIQGETASYTFLRQVALFVNLLVKIQSSVLVLKSKSFLVKKGLLVPIYEN